jgi:hypothetical protein
MDLNFKEIKFFYLNHVEYTDRKIKMDSFISELGLTATRIVNDSTLPLRQDRISIGFIKILNAVIEKNTFPSIICEDDIALIANFPTKINIPQNATIILLGGSTYESGGIKPKIHITNYDDNFYRVYHMLSSHAVLIPNLKSANFFLDILNSSLKTSEFHDVNLAMKSSEMLYLTPKNGPYFYQDNYNDQVTKFLWKDNLHDYLST